MNSLLAQGTAVQTDIGEFSNIGGYVSALFNTWAMPIITGLAVLMFIYAGYLYMTSQGNQEQISLAKEIIIGVIAGVLLLFTAWILLNNVIGIRTI